MSSTNHVSGAYTNEIQYMQSSRMIAAVRGTLHEPRRWMRSRTHVQSYVVVQGCERFHAQG